MEIGNKVKYSEYATRKHLDYYLSLGDYSRKNRAKEYYEEQCAKRGVITGIISTCGEAYVIKWNDGVVSKTAGYMVEKA